MRRGSCTIVLLIEHANQELLQDAVLAAEAGVDGILLSNHGGENQFSRSTILVDLDAGRQLDW